MSNLIYHVERENRNHKHYLVLRLESPSGRKLSLEDLPSLTSSPSEKQLLSRLIQTHCKLFPAQPIERLFFPADDSFAMLKQLGTTGRLYMKGRKVAIDPFSSGELVFELEKKTVDSAQITSYWRLGQQSSPLLSLDWVFVADPSWTVQGGIVRAFREEVPAKWVEFALEAHEMEGKNLFSFLEKVESEVPVQWKTSPVSSQMDPLPFLVLADRHGAFADLWFDYGVWGQIAFHDLTCYPWRNLSAEAEWEKDLLETDFIRKLVESSHYYCPLNTVAKSLTFLLEVGWKIQDHLGRKVLRQTHTQMDARAQADQILVQAQVFYGHHRTDVTDLLGAFNRREQFVELSSHEVGLLDQERFHQKWSPLLQEEVVVEGFLLKKNRIGVLEPYLDQETATLHEGIRDKIQDWLGRVPSVVLQPSERFLGGLFPYQQKGLEWLQFLQEGGWGGLLADEMGLGKTVQVLAFFSLLPPSQPLLVVMPTSLLFNWQREVETFLPSLALYRHEGPDRLRTVEELKRCPLILTSYALLRIDAELFKSVDFQVVVLDEAQAIKNPDSQIAEVCCSLLAKTRIAITGTPVENRLEDLWSLFRFLQPDLLGGKKEFQSQILSAQSNPFCLERMKLKLRPFILRRKKEDVSLDLPPKLEQTVWVEMEASERALYEEWLQKTTGGLLKKVALDGAVAHRLEILEAILRLRQICAHPRLIEPDLPIEGSSAKWDRMFSDLQEVIEEQRKVLVYSQFTTVLRLMSAAAQEKGWNSVYLDGNTKNREEVVCQFQQQKEVSIFFISLKAGGVGLNLTAADYVFLYDPWWNEAVEAQAMDRAHRLGRCSTLITRRYLTALSIEEKMERLKQHKKSLSQTLLDAAPSASHFSLEELLDLL